MRGADDLADDRGSDGLPQFGSTEPRDCAEGGECLKQLRSIDHGGFRQSEHVGLRLTATSYERAGQQLTALDGDEPLSAIGQREYPIAPLPGDTPRGMFGHHEPECLRHESEAPEMAADATARCIIP